MTMSIFIGVILAKTYLSYYPSEELRPIDPLLLAQSYNDGYQQGLIPIITTVYDYDTPLYILGYLEGKREGAVI